MYVPLLNCILTKFYIYLFRIKYIVHRLFIFTFTYTFVIYKNLLDASFSGLLVSWLGQLAADVRDP